VGPGVAVTAAPSDFTHAIYDAMRMNEGQPLTGRSIQTVMPFKKGDLVRYHARSDYSMKLRVGALAVVSSANDYTDTIQVIPFWLPSPDAFEGTARMKDGYLFMSDVWEKIGEADAV
jgi:hypothetical protein